ncbi:excinuclease ABC subunit UvrA [Chryseobacterium indologenes]|uniref:ATP-binding cassette domain-containing protein n=1 Tax=Chryseobacterium indologenes TaxID=253 RepID=UPI000F50BEB7|nr:excinuclease ABC subunit UvrA [Chryseobacterium indologenes]AYZ36286.1 excinuclease ABC subunit UvrA [Chryseobacterium indologenes]MBF6644934.1 excinuclease ABC subunit UvrA [Chryseobacterium indologenes]MBU3047506.1 excinuclease ABC subunit UvrA [Chryseobacterium indologenes]MEB4759209.1 excinuclease ABC subunit UvrA [Chryseobacterium indologenes]QQQ71382.1 excinuclease ABC subunit UvrA [Chryseobacterium indologenes]
MENIEITNARQNNLRNVSIKIPKHEIVVFTGVSGSGKSSLVFETIGAEAQRQINETQNSFIRNRLQHYGVPDVDKIENLNVPIIINQKRLGGNARSTVGTAADVSASLRLLFSRMGKPFVGYSNVFSFNNPQGMCPECEGLGFVQALNINTLIDKNKSLLEGAIRFPTFQPGGWRLTRYTLSGYFDNDKKLKDFSGKEWEMLLYAPEHKPKHPHKDWGKTVKYEGIIPRIEKAFLKKDSKENITRKDALNTIVMTKTCPVCEGKRLNEKILSCKIKGKNIADCSSMAIDELLEFINSLDSKMYEVVISELSVKLQNIITIGLQYLTLDRSTNTLSGGESQRIKMVRSLGNSLVDLLYIFDEPSIGLHPKDLQNIISIIKQIRDKGNSVLIVEHDPDLIKMADHIVDMGPGSGKNGGEVVYEGTFEHLKASKGKTGAYFARKPSVKNQFRKPDGVLKIENANLYNLKNVSVNIPTGVMSVITGVAGSGKSTLINRVLPDFYPDLTIIDQSLFAASARSNLLTYLGISDTVRKLFAQSNHVSEKLFSRNSEGACPNCKGLGVERIDLAFMDDIEQPCEVCSGSGFNPDVLKYQYKGKTIAEVMSMTVSEGVLFLKDESVLKNFDLLLQLGLDYLTLGQRLDSFSGGERQRLKLTKELKNTGQIIVLDEPSTGLHPSDTQKLLTFFNHLVEQGNTLIVIEHNLDIIAQADWIIDIGPGAGKYGGKIVFEGTPQDLLKDKKSYTAEFLRKHIH